MQYAFDNSNDLSNFEISEDSIFAARVCSIFELPHESGVQISKLYIEWQAQHSELTDTLTAEHQ